VITAAQPGQAPAGMAVGSFTSVSLEPPLIAFLPDRGSSSWPKIEQAGKFCVNVLSADQEQICRRFATKMPDKFAGLAWRPASSGAPIIEGVVAWVACEIESVQPAGDHYVVIGRVRELRLEKPGLPLLFYQGGYGRFLPLSMAAGEAPGLGDHLRLVDLVRDQMEAVSEELSCQCVAWAQIADELVILAHAGISSRRGASTLAGARLPFVPPLGSPWVAWGSDDLRRHWLAQIKDPNERSDYEARLASVVERGCSVGIPNPAHREFSRLLEQSAQSRASAAAASDFRRILEGLVYDPAELPTDDPGAVRIVSVPVLDRASKVRLVLTIYGFPRPTTDGDLQRIVDLARAAGNLATAHVRASY
jgi:flavin reductase (DIM6/NTAB) family NADH-FMN oxidoreductase RutF